MDQVTKQDVSEVAQALGLESISTNRLRAELVKRDVKQRELELLKLKQILGQLEAQIQQETK